MSDENKKLEITFAPGAFDWFDGTQEELDALIEEVKKVFEDGSYLDNSIPLTDEEYEDFMKNHQPKKSLN